VIARDVLLQIAQVLATLLLAPLLQGVILQFEERVQRSQGPGIFQPYRDLWKLFHKQIVVPETASWLYWAAPIVAFTTTLTVPILIPVLTDFPLPLSDMGDILGGGRGRQGGRARRGQRGADLRYDLSLTFEEAATGVRTKVKVFRHENCAGCNGTGAKPGSGMAACQTCAGRGQLHYQQGFFSISRTCPACQGAGQTIREACTQCRGQGRIEREKILEVAVPAGVDSETRLRLAGEGEPGTNGGATGDLYIFFEIKEHPYFERRNADLFCTIPITFAQAALGAKIKVPTLTVEEELEIPEGTQSGQIFRKKGKGLPNPHGGKGDLYINVRVDIPAKLTRDQKRIVEQLGQVLKSENKPAERSTSFFDKVKDIFG